MSKQYNFQMGHFWNAPAKSIKRRIHYHGEMVKHDKYSNIVEKFERQVMIK